MWFFTWYGAHLWSPDPRDHRLGDRCRQHLLGRVQVVVSVLLWRPSPRQALSPAAGSQLALGSAPDITDTFFALVNGPCDARRRTGCDYASYPPPSFGLQEGV